MTALAFTCSYASVRDLEATSPCGRRIHARGRGVCLGHIVTRWMMRSLGDTEHARNTWSFLLIFLFADTAVSAVRETISATPDASGVVLDAVCSLFFAGLALALATEHPWGGLLWLFTAPLAGAAEAVYGVGRLPDHLASPPEGAVRHPSRMLDTLQAFAYFTVAFTVVAAWVAFLLSYAGLYRWERRAQVAITVGQVGLAVTAIVVAVASGGSKNGILTWCVVMIGATVMARGIGRIKKLVGTFRV
jgi:hypothetical protein